MSLPPHTKASAPVDANTQPATTSDGIPLFANGRALTDVEIGALREAKDRRIQVDAREKSSPEIGGARRTTDPTRYDDWEVAGRAIDF